MSIKDGKRLEQFLDSLHATYRAQGNAVIAKVPNPVRILSKGNPRQRKAPLSCHLLPPVWVDYTGVVMGGIAVAIEAKCTTDKGPSFALSKLAKHQHQTLTLVNAMGGIAMLYVRRIVGLQRDDYLVPISFIDELEKRSFRWSEVEQYRVPTGRTWLDCLTPGYHFVTDGPADVRHCWIEYCTNGWAE